MATKLYDVLVIGGGPGGLGFATAIARQLYSVLVLDSGVYRNALSKHMHTVPGFDHVDPALFRQKARADLQKRYESIEFKSATVETVRKLDGNVFEAIDEQGQVFRGKKLVLASGIRDLVEGEIPGYKQCWARGIFHCLFCHGFEERGAQSTGVLATGFMIAPEMVTHVTKMTKRLSQNVTIYTNGNSGLATEAEKQLHSSKISYDDRKIEHLALVGEGPNVTLTFADGTSKTEGFLAGIPKFEQSSPFASQLGLEMTPTGDIKVEAPFNKTSLAGCVAVGDAATMMKSAMQAIHMGTVAGAGLVFELQNELEEKDEL